MVGKALWRGKAHDVTVQLRTISGGRPSVVEQDKAFLNQGHVTPACAIGGRGG
jgi:hypothetical protein